MGTSFTIVSKEVFAFAVDLAASARVFTIEQIATHRDLCGRSQPKRRAREFLAPYRDSFEVLPWFAGKPYIWRLTEKEKKKRGIQYRSVAPSQHTDHWLAIGDMWMELVRGGMRPEKWFTEGKAIGRFDVFMVIHKQPYLVELQITELKKNEWQQKWHKRVEWMKTRPWNNEKWAIEFSPIPPKVLLVTRDKMKLEEGIHLPRRGVYVANKIKDTVPLIRKMSQA